jgi:valyl-tRNA synthetase
MNLIDLPTRYDASTVEQKWYSAWESAGLFEPNPDPDLPVYSITIPPPNITGSLHMGHALCYPIQDALGRYRRLRGDSVLILPGQDHAGIATQSVVAKQLKAEGKNPAGMGRDAFVERVWEWRKESGDTILHQLRRLGCAFDWTRQRFTLDENYASAVTKVFVDWFDRGYVYLGERVVNWDPVLETSVSDIETERVITKGKLFHVRYPFADGSGHLVVATTRPETMLGDVAVAVHPSDRRYHNLIGKTLILPLVGREIPLIADTYPDPEFGTGAVKITPAHDANDFEVGVRHSLPMPVVFDSRGKVNENGGAYSGLDRREARKRIVADLEAAGLLEKIDDHEIALTVSERSGEPIEPMLREEWFVKQSEFAAAAAKVVEDGKIRFVPDRYEDIFLDWLEGLRDWNVSRNLWWGHRIPVFYAEDGSFAAATNKDEAEKKLGKTIVRQDERVLDTWFSSGLWPFATLGWPNETDDLKAFYPTNVLVTSREILFLWVARMVMMGLDFAKDIPFRDVYLYATVLTESGKRMSKSLGTGVDPMQIIETKGADALRYTLFSQTGYNQDIRYSEKRTDDARNFCNKIWNASRFILMHCRERPEEPKDLELVDKWLLGRLAETVSAVQSAYDSYNLQEVCANLYRFFWNELCDWYIEVCKKRLESGELAPKWVLLKSLEAFLAMMHPIMPHITEEIFSHLPGTKEGDFIMSSSWPSVPRAESHSKSEAAVERAFSITRAVRALRAELGISPGKAIPYLYIEGDINGIEEVILSQSWVTDLRLCKPPETESCFYANDSAVEIHLPLGESNDETRLSGELERLEKELVSIDTDIAVLDKRLSNPQFIERAKPEIVAEVRSQMEELTQRKDKLQVRRKLFED